ncbi:MAG: DNA/RNA helicase domain-containing protein [Candidatus Thiodiazotropha sp.]
MIVYSATKAEFNDDVVSNVISDKILDKFQEKLGRTTSKQEIESWKNSMMYMNNILSDKGIPSNAGVSIEYKIPQTSNRIDFILTGKDKHKTDTAIIVELKQWTDVKRTDKDAIVETFLGGGEREVNHPSYQAWTYAALLLDFNETVRVDEITLRPCAYLHNCESYDVINHSCYHEHTEKAPSFLKNDTQHLRSFIKQHVKYGDSNNIMYRIDHGKIKPSKNLAEILVSLMKGNPEFIMIDDQKIVFETVLALAEKSTPDDKHVLIVEGGPGTGKSVVAINLLVTLTQREMLVQYVTKNAAPREVYLSKLTGSFKKSHINNLFKGSGGFHYVEPNCLDVLVVDEAHRLAERGIYDPVGGNQIKEIIGAAKHSVFFIDEDQRVTWKDIGEKQEIRKWAGLAGAKVLELELVSQFRCNGSDGYLSWVDNGLQIRQTANETLEGIDYDFRVFDTPNELRDVILDKNRKNNMARLVAGYCWDWVSKKDPSKNDIVFKDYNFFMKWNLKTDGSLWIMKPETVKEIGCIHTCQGLELEYIGVIIGPDLIVRDGKIITDAAQRSKMDSSVKGYKKLLKENPQNAKARADTIIKNTYRTLMTRGQKGCYIYCTDPETNAYFKGLVSEKLEKAESHQKEPILPFRKISPEDVRPYENAVPLYDLDIAAGGFSEPQQVNECEWVELPDSFRLQKGHFVARVVGESMNKRIPNGSWCLFKANPGGSRNNKVVLIQHRDIEDQDTGGTYTVKLYSSEKKTDCDDWRHTKIVLKPDSYINGYRNLIFDVESEGELHVVGEFVAVLG